MLKYIAVIGFTVLSFCFAGHAQTEASNLPEAASAASEIAASTEELIPTLDESQQAQVRLWLEDLKKPDAKRSREALERIGAGALPMLLAALEQGDTVQGQQVIEVLGRIGHKAALPKLRELMLGKNQWLRGASVFAIAEIGGKGAVPILLEALKDPSCRVCEIAVRILVDLGDLRAAPGLIDLLRNPDPQLAQAASQGLVQLTDGMEDYGTDWMSWQLWYESEVLIKGLGNGHGDQ